VEVKCFSELRALCLKTFSHFFSKINSELILLKTKLGETLVYLSME